MGDSKFCDRCHSPGRTQSGFGIDLCPRCIADLPEWVDAGKRILTIRQVKRTSKLRIATSLCALHGYVTSALLAEALGEDRRSKANWSLHHYARNGKLIYCGNGRFRLPGERPVRRVS